MTKILMWDKPKKVRTKTEWENHAGFDGGPPGGYAPNMSEDDEKRWRAKIVGTKTGYPQVEIRKTAGSIITLVVSLGGGYNYKSYTVGGRYHDKTLADFSGGYIKSQSELDRYSMMDSTTLGINVHMSMNGPALLTFEDMANMQLAIQEAKEALEALEDVPGERENYVAILHGSAIMQTAEKRLAAISGVRVQHRFVGDKPSGGMIGFSAPAHRYDILEAIYGLDTFKKIITRTEAKELARNEWEEQWGS